MTYLDTHVVEHLGLNRTNYISKEAARRLGRDPDLRISPTVLLEMEYLREIGRIRTGRDELLSNVRKSFSLRVCDLPFKDVAIQAAAESWTRDPFDRMIVAQARLAKAVLISRDSHILANYSKAIG